jgi:hypothetical protein
MIVTLEGRDGIQSITNNLPQRSFDEIRAILDDIEDNIEEDEFMKGKVEAQLATGGISTKDTDVVEIGHIWWSEE